MRVTQRWFPLALGGFGIFLVVVFGGIGGYAWFHPEDGPTMRIAIPLYVVAVYLVVACLANLRTAGVTRDGIWFLAWPIPVMLPRRIGREKIRHCYVRNLRQVSRYPNNKELGSYFSVGVETLAGHQIDISGSQETADEAKRLASEVVGILNQAPGGDRIKAVEVSQLPPRVEVMRILLRMLFWLAVCLTAIFLGVLWELAYDRERRR